MADTTRPAQPRTCAGMGLGHEVDDTAIIGMVRVDESVKLYCHQHATSYDRALNTIGRESNLLQM